MNKKIIIFSAILIVAVVGTLIAVAPRGEIVDTNYDFFAKCLTKEGFTMYGASWCPHCLREKKAFGSSFKYVQYVECPDNPQKCTDAGILSFPTWIDHNGTKYVGEQGIIKLSTESGCPIANPAKI